MRRPSLSLVAVLALLAGASGLLAVWVQGREDAPELVPGSPVERELRGGATGSFLIDLQSGDYLHAVVEQRGVDVVVTLLDPTGRELLTVDSPNGKEGPEPLLAVARTAGPHRLTVRSLSAGAAGWYAVRIEELRPATGKDHSRAAAAESFAHGEALRALGGTVSLRRALAAYKAALRDWRILDEKRGQAAALRGIGQVSYALADLRGARDAFLAALKLCRELGDRKAAAPLLNDAGAVYQSLSELGKAEAAFLGARDLFRSLEDRRGEAAALNLLGGLRASRADLRGALDAYSQALASWRALGDRSREALTLHDLGRTYSLLGRPSEALDLLRQTLRLRRAAGDRRGEASTLTEIGWAHYLSGDSAAALRFYDQALALHRREGNLLGEAAVLDRRGTALTKAGRLVEALPSYRKALAIFQQAGQPGSMAHTLANLGWLYEARGDPLAAMGYEERALRLFRRLGDRHAAAHTLFGIARAERRRGHLDLARARIQETLAIAESLRGEAPIQALRTSYLAARHEYYEFAVDLLMQMGLDAESWEVAERARARSLLESVGEGARATAIDEDLGRLGGELRSRLRDGGGAGAVSASIRLREVQQQVLDRDTLLLQYALGAERSFLWVVGSESIESYVIPGRRRLEELARRAYGLLARSRKGSLQQQARLAAAALTDAILGPAAGPLASRRLVIVADGALQYVPFAALSLPSKDGSRAPLLAQHEVVALPSVSVLARLRRERAHRPAPSRLVAVVADPVFERDDPRLRSWRIPAVTLAAASTLPGGRDLERSAGDVGIDHLARLPWSRREAEAILSLVPPGEGLRALDFAASRSLVLSGRLGPYRIIHFATHGLLNAEHPDLSGLVLSRFDDRGRPQEGFLRVQEVPALGLRADLVVLSACRTALGKEVAGEGLLGLTQAFFQAGAGRVVVSLWNVNDAASAELMSRFYQAMLRQRLPPSAALRSAQLAMLRQPRWQAPYYWAGFSLQGEWR